MSRPQIKIRWNSEVGDDYAASVSALELYRPAPTITASLGVKGNFPKEVMVDIVRYIQERSPEDTTVSVTLTAVWAEDSDQLQLRLFDPPEAVKPVEGLTFGAN